VSKRKHKKIPKRVTAGWLRKIGVKEVLIPGLLMAGILGWTEWRSLGPDIYKNKTLFPESGVVREVIDGDTFELVNGVRVRMVGINAPDRGDAGEERATEKLKGYVEKKRVWLEYDRYQDDKSGRILAWVWRECEEKPKFTPPDYMRLSYNRSRRGLTENPEGCKKGKLVQEELMEGGFAKIETYKVRGDLKYEERLLNK
jgi:hypothetical protein